MIYFFQEYHRQTVADFFTSHTSPISQCFRFFFVTFMSDLWFLPMIFGIYLATPLLMIVARYANDFDNFYFIALWFLFVSVVPFFVNNPLFPVWEPNVLLAPLQYSGYFLSGYIVTKQKVFNNIRLPILLLITVSPFLFSLLPLKEKYIQPFVSEFLFPGTIIASIFFFYFLFAASNKLDSHVSPLVRKIIAMVSGACFGVYIVHVMLFYFFSKLEIITALHAYHAEFLLTIITFSISTIIVLLLQRIPVIKYIVPK